MFKFIKKAFDYAMITFIFFCIYFCSVLLLLPLCELYAFFIAFIPASIIGASLLIRKEENE